MYCHKRQRNHAELEMSFSTFLNFESCWILVCFFAWSMYLNVAVNLNVAVLTARISFRYGVLTCKKDCQWGSDSLSCADPFRVHDSVEWSLYFTVK